MLAPGMTAPELSTTVPDSVDVTPPCAYSAGAPTAITAIATRAVEISLRAVRVMNCSFEPVELNRKIVRRGVLSEPGLANERGRCTTVSGPSSLDRYTA